MAIVCCTKCALWNSCVPKWVKTEKNESSYCCSSCSSYSECVRKDIDLILSQGSSKIDWIRRELDEVFNPVADKKYIYGLNHKEFKVFIANYALSGFWMVFGLQTKILDQSALYTLAIIPSVLIFWIILKKVQFALRNNRA